MRKLGAKLLALCCGLAANAALAQDVTVAWLRLQEPPRPTLSNLDPVPGDLGLMGARLGLADNATTGKFMQQTWGLEEIDLPPDGDLSAALAKALEITPFVVLDAPAAAQLAAADLTEAANALLFNSSAPELALRGTECRANLLHTIPSRAMLTDALMQFVVARRWTRLAMIAGPAPGDAAFAAALQRSATKFGLIPPDPKPWSFDADMRRNAAQEVPLFTQDLPDHDLLLVADEANDFARYIPYNTWQPRPVAGSEGLVPAGWSASVEQWGAAQLQSRFTDLAGRPMHSRDYAAWAALRTLGEAVTRTKSADPATLRAYILGPDFELAGFKGSPLSYRTWNGQLRQPIPLSTRSAPTAMAPLDGFLHQRHPLDTLGLDQPESGCTAFGD